jgi:hypothetical protein
MTNPMLFAKERRVSKGIELLLSLAHQRIEPSFHIGQLVSNMIHENLDGRRKRFSQSGC